MLQKQFKSSENDVNMRSAAEAVVDLAKLAITCIIQKHEITENKKAQRNYFMVFFRIGK